MAVASLHDKSRVLMSLQPVHQHRAAPAAELAPPITTSVVRVGVTSTKSATGLPAPLTNARRLTTDPRVVDDVVKCGIPGWSRLHQTWRFAVSDEHTDATAMRLFPAPQNSKKHQETQRSWRPLSMCKTPSSAGKNTPSRLSFRPSIRGRKRPASHAIFRPILGPPSGPKNTPRDANPSHA
jgi:hypothetical protein